MYTNYITRDKLPAPSETITRTPRALEDIKHLSVKRTPSSSQGPREEVSFVKFGEYDGEAGLRNTAAEGEASLLGGQQERRDRAQARPDE